MASKSPLTLRAMKRQRTLRLARLLSRAFFLRQRGRKTDMYNLICDEMVSLGGVYVKFLQGVLLNGNVMKQWRNPDRMKIFENLETEKIDVISILRNEVPPALLQDIVSVQPEPFAAGSFGQVYLGQHRNGRHIIIKVLRPQVRELLRHDLRLLAVFSRRFTAGEYKNINIKLDQAIKEFREVTLRETDYIAEAEFARELFEAYKDHPTMIIPETYLELCTPHVIVQDYLGGVSAVEVLRQKERGIEPADYIRTTLGSDIDIQLITLGTETLRGAFNLPRIQGDPHPGNIRFLPDNKIGMIDFGIAAQSPSNRSAFFGIIDQWGRLYQKSDNIASLFEQFMRFFVNDLYKALVKVGSYQASRQPIENDTGTAASTNFTRELGRIVQEILQSAIGTADLQTTLEDGRMIHIFNNVVNNGNRFGLVVRLESSEILRATQTYMTMIEALGRRRAVIPQVFSQVAQIVEAEHPNIRTQTEDPISITQALETINSWLERVAMRDPALFDKLMRRIKLNNVKAPTPATKTEAEPTNA